MAAAAFWAFGAGALLVGALLGFWLGVSRRTLGLIMGFGAGTLLSAVSFDLVFEAVQGGPQGTRRCRTSPRCFCVLVGRSLIERMQSTPTQTAESELENAIEEPGSGLQLALGATLDGVPESVATALTLLGGSSVSVAVVVAVFPSNVPEGMALRRISTHGIRTFEDPGNLGGRCRSLRRCRDHRLRRTGRFPPRTIAVIQSFAAGSILAMLSITMMPQAFSKGGRAVGLLTVLGFILAAGLAAQWDITHHDKRRKQNGTSHSD